MGAEGMCEKSQCHQGSGWVPGTGQSQLGKSLGGGGGSGREVSQGGVCSQLHRLLPVQPRHPFEASRASVSPSVARGW